MVKEISRRGRRRSHDEKGNQGVGDFRFINILQLFSANYLLIFSITFTLSFFFQPFFTPTFTHTHDPGPLSTTHVKYTEFLLRLRKKIQVSKKHLIDRGSPQTLIENLLSCMNFTDRECAKNNNKEDKRNTVPFETQYQPSVSTLKEGSMKKWNLIQSYFAKFFKEPLIISYKKGKSIKYMLIRA